MDVVPRTICVFVLALAGCAGPLEGPVEDRRVVHLGDHDEAPGLRLAGGRRWISPRALAGETAATVPADVGALVAFIDHDGDGWLDPFAEPSTPCRERPTGWECAVPDRQVTIYRLSAGDERTTFVIPRWGLADRLDDAGARFCLGTAAGCATGWHPEPRTRDAVGALSACADDDLVLWTDDVSGRRHLRAARRPPLDVEISVDPGATDDLAVRIDGAGAAELDRLHAWIGDEQDPAWHSELPGARWVRGEGGWSLAIPARAVRACGACAVGVAVADHAMWRDERTSAMVLDVRETRQIFQELVR